MKFIFFSLNIQINNIKIMQAFNVKTDEHNWFRNFEIMRSATDSN